MNRNRILVIAVVAYLGAAVARLVKYHNEQKNIRIAESVAIYAARDVVLAKIRNGDYRGKTLDDVYKDFDFYQIAYHNEQM